jgi:hypothetical protein
MFWFRLAHLPVMLAAEKSRRHRQDEHSSNTTSDQGRSNGIATVEHVELTRNNLLVSNGLAAHPAVTPLAGEMA